MAKQVIPTPWPGHLRPGAALARPGAARARLRAPLRAAARGPGWRAAAPPLLASAGRVKEERERDFRVKGKRSVGILGFDLERFFPEFLQSEFYREEEEDFSLNLNVRMNLFA